MLLSTVLEKVVMVLVVVVELGARILQKDTRVNVISFTRRVSLSLALSRRLFSHVLFRLGHIRRENNALQSRDARSLARSLAGSREFIRRSLVKRAKK